MKKARGNPDVHQGCDVIALTQDFHQGLQPRHTDQSLPGRWLRVAGKRVDDVAKLTEHAGDHSRLFAKRLFAPRRTPREAGGLIFGAALCEARQLLGRNQGKHRVFPGVHEAKLSELCEPFRAGPLCQRAQCTKGVPGERIKSLSEASVIEELCGGSGQAAHLSSTQPATFGENE